MDVYILDNAWAKSQIVEGFNSFIWTERYDTASDFQIDFYPTDTVLLGQLTEKRYISHSETDMPMQIETVKSNVNDEGEEIVTVTGRSLETILLENRIIVVNYGAPKNQLTAAANLKDLVADYLRGGVGSNYSDDPFPEDKVPQLDFQQLDSSGDTFVYVRTFEPVLTAVSELAASNNLGFKIVTGNPGKIVFVVYKGAKRTNVVFSRKMDSLGSESFVTSGLTYKNVAYVLNKPQGFDNPKVTPIVISGDPSDYTGLNRRVLAVDATDIDQKAHGYTNDVFSALVRKRGTVALTKARRTNVISGEVPIDAPYKYNVHYKLGDVVYFQGRVGGKQSVRVTEYIWSLDGTGKKQYPTFVDTDS